MLLSRKETREKHQTLEKKRLDRNPTLKEKTREKITSQGRNLKKTNPQGNRLEKDTPLKQ